MSAQYKTRSLIHVFLIGIIALLINACGSGGQESDNSAIEASDTDAGSGSLALSIQWPASVRVSTIQNHRAANLDCTAANVATVEAQVYSPAEMLIGAGGPWDCDTGQGIINKIEPTSGCIVVVLAKNPEGQIVYRGAQDGVNIIAGQTARAQITAEPFTPQLISPANGTQDTSVTCVWESVSGAELYEMRISEYADMHQYTIIQAAGTSLKPAGITAGTTYYCQIAAKDRFGNTGCGSNISDFSVTLGSPELIYPGKGDVVLPGTVTLTWQGPEENLTYHVAVATNSDLSNPLMDQETTTPGQVEFDLANAENGQTYYWQVAALDAEGNRGAPSEKFGFTAGEANLYLNKPENNTIFPKENIRFNWIPIQPTPVAYRVTISKAINPEHAIDIMITTDPYYKSDLLKNATDYIWKVEAIDENGTATYISQTWTVSTLDKPRLVAPINRTGRHLSDITFEWQNVPNQGYQIIIAADEVFDNVVRTELLDKNITTLNSDDLDLDSARTYYWGVCPLNSNSECHINYFSNPYQIKTMAIKLLFAIDSSGSMGTAGYGSDPDNLRLLAVRQFIENYNSYHDISFEIILWNEGIYRATTTVNGRRGFIKDTDEIDKVLSNVVNTNNSDYVGIINAIHHDISEDIEMVNDHESTAHTKYIVIFLADGIDNVPGQEVFRETEILNAIEKLVQMTENKGVGNFTLNTFLLANINMDDDYYQQCSSLLLQISKNGHGLFQAFESPDGIDFISHINMR